MHGQHVAKWHSLEWCNNNAREDAIPMYVNECLTRETTAAFAHEKVRWQRKWAKEEIVW